MVTTMTTDHEPIDLPDDYPLGETTTEYTAWIACPTCGKLTIHVNKVFGLTQGMKCSLCGIYTGLWDYIEDTYILATKE